MLYCWGWNPSGQVGNNTTGGGQTTPYLVLSDARQVAAGGRHSCAIRSDDSVWCWGGNDRGQLGVSGGDRDSPVQTDGGALVAVEIELGGRHSCARLTDGSVRCWGSNTHGQLGNGGTQDRDTPVPVVGLGNVEKIWAGGRRTCARLADQTIWCWGETMYGAAGSGSIGSEPPTLIAEFGQTKRMLVSSYHTCLTDALGALLCAGRNNTGQLGIGTTTDTQSPQPTLLQCP